MFKGSVWSARILIGGILIILGTLFLLDNYEIIYFEIPDFIFRWQSILIVIGLIAFLSSGNKIPGLVMLTIGLIGFFPKFWSIILIAIGIYIILRNKGYGGSWLPEISSKIKSPSGKTETVLNDVSIFGGSNKVLQSDNFNGGKITAIFGGSEIDLTNCGLSPGENIIDIVAMFGGTTIFAPSSWEIIIDVVPIFGGFSDKRRKEPLTDTESKGVLIVKGFVIFGGGEIKN